MKAFSLFQFAFLCCFSVVRLNLRYDSKYRQARIPKHILRRLMIHITNIAWMLYILSIIVWSLHDFEPCVNLFYKWKRLFLGKIVFYSTFFTSSDSFLNFYQTLQPKCRIYTGDSIFQERVVLLFYWSYFLNQRSPVRLVDWRCPRLKTICPTVCLGQVLLL